MGAGQGPEVLAEALIQQLEEGLDARRRAAQELPGITIPSALWMPQRATAEPHR